MKKDPVITAKGVIVALGGADNILSATHCATRLRVEVRDASRVQEENIKELDGVAGYFEQNGQHQVILGTGFVNKVHLEVTKLLGHAPPSSDQVEKPKGTAFQRVTKDISDIFIPIIPILLATGILMGLQGLWVNGFGFTMSKNVSVIFSVLTETAYVFIPVLVCWSANKKYGGSPIIGIVLGLMLVSPILPNKWDVVNGAADPLLFPIGPIDLTIVGYQSSVLPALCMGIVAALLEKKLNKVIPDLVNMLFVPFLTVSISLLTGLFLVGPILSLIEKGLTDLILYSLTLPFGIGGIVYGGGIQLLCVVGMHHTVTPVIVSIFAQTGLDYINPLGTAAIAGQLGAGLAVVMMERNRRKRSKMVPALIPALFGISEPVMYGLTFPTLKPFFMGCLGGAAGGAFAGIIQLAAKGTGASMIPGAFLYLDGGLFSYLIVLAISISVAYVGTVLITSRDRKKQQLEQQIA
ncbi:PTS transporter subunit EIIC (plasmid) [Rossellomorea sp. FS2]|uniref:PTS transporter subunit EIIC n=1 Tax=Rossellomorea sp. FS2 TaxID=3391447 RepID=UPI003A4E64A3